MLTEKTTSLKLLGVASSSSSAGACFNCYLSAHSNTPGRHGVGRFPAILGTHVPLVDGKVQVVGPALLFVNIAVVESFGLPKRICFY